HPPPRRSPSAEDFTRCTGVETAGDGDLAVDGSRGEPAEPGKRAASGGPTGPRRAAGRARLGTGRGGGRPGGTRRWPTGTPRCRGGRRVARFVACPRFPGRPAGPGRSCSAETEVT